MMNAALPATELDQYRKVLADVFDRACERALSSRSIINLREREGAAAKILRLPDGATAYVLNNADNQTELGICEADSLIIQWIATRNEDHFTFPQDIDAKRACELLISCKL